MVALRVSAILTEIKKVGGKICRKHLFLYIEIKNYKWEKDPQGINHGYSNLESPLEIWLYWGYFI